MALSKASIACLQESLSIVDASISSLGRLRDRYQTIDRYQQKTSRNTAEDAAGEIANKSGNKKIIANQEIGLTKIQRESAQAYLAGIFLTGSPIFAATANRENEAGASMLSALTARDQERFGWIAEFNRAIQDVLSYNICAAEVTWAKKTAASIQTDIQSPKEVRGKNLSPEQSAQVTAKPVPVIYQGNMVKRLDPYNLILDPSVEPAQVTEKGTYAGYIEVKDYISVVNLYREWNTDSIVHMNKSSILSKVDQVGYTSYHYVPNISNYAKVSTERNWPVFFGSNTGFTKPVKSTGKYEVITLYRRLIPSEFNLETPDKLSAATPQVYKLVWIDNKLAMAEKVVSGHEYLPIAVGQYVQGNTDVKSFTEDLCDIQDLASSMINGSLEAMRRAVNDRALYDPTKINPAHFRSGADAKIPVNKNVFGGDLTSAYHAIPYQDTVSGQLNAMLGTAFTLGERTTGQNQSTQGSFIKGNKTVQEFNTIMSNSESRLQLGALNLHSSFFRAIKEIIKINFFLYASTESLENPTNKSIVEIDPTVLRNVAPNYKMADGIMPTTKMANTDVFIQAFQIMSTSPQAMVEYDIMGMLLSVLRQQGFTDLDAYKNTEEQRQRMLMNLQQQTQATSPQQQQGGE